MHRSFHLISCLTVLVEHRADGEASCLLMEDMPGFVGRSNGWNGVQVLVRTGPAEPRPTGRGWLIGMRRLARAGAWLAPLFSAVLGCCSVVWPAHQPGTPFGCSSDPPGGVYLSNRKQIAGYMRSPVFSRARFWPGASGGGSKAKIWLSGLIYPLLLVCFGRSFDRLDLNINQSQPGRRRRFRSALLCRWLSPDSGDFAEWAPLN